jgi:DNA primase catalytic core
MDLTGNPYVGAGYAPAGWTHLVEHLGGHGATDEELLTAGLAALTRNGRLIDRFRDRLVLPITRDSDARPGQVELLGFVARRHPRHTDHTNGGPKYLNTPDTPLFHKGAQLYTTGRPGQLGDGAVPVLVEGPLDALAVTVSGAGRYVGLAPLGTALTDEQALQLTMLAHEAGTAPIVAADADPAGQQATERAFWLLTQHALHPEGITLHPGSDPADTLTRDGPEALRRTLEASTPLSHHVVAQRLHRHTGLEALRAATAAVAADRPEHWDYGTQQIADITHIPLPVVRRELAKALQERAHDPRAVTEKQVTAAKIRPGPPPLPAVEPGRRGVPAPTPRVHMSAPERGPSR